MCQTNKVRVSRADERTSREVRERRLPPVSERKRARLKDEEREACWRMHICGEERALICHTL